MKDSRAERGRTDYWVREMNACVKRAGPQIERYTRFVRWYRGYTQDMIDEDATPGLDYQWQQNLDNMTTFVTDSTIADLFFRNPTFTVECPYGMQRGVFTPALARIETTNLKDKIEQIGYFRKKRRQILDARLGPYGVLKWTYNVGDWVVDMESIEAARLEAKAEIAGFLAGNARALSAKESQNHAVHIDEKSRLLAEAERGVIQLPRAAMKFLRKHLKEHDFMRGSERPTEVARNMSIVCLRQNLLNWFYDPTVDDMDQCRWFASASLHRKVDVMASTRYSAKAKQALNEAQDHYIRSDVVMPGGVISTGSFDGSEVLIRIYEVVDLVDGVIREFAEGGQIMLDEREYTMRDIQPHGPYNILMFKQDPQEAAGIPPPVAWESPQAAATALASVNVAVAQLALPRVLCNERTISPELAQKIHHDTTGMMTPIPNIPMGEKLAEQFAQAPMAELSPTNMSVLMDVRSQINQLSGRGGQKNLSGDRSGSATEAAIVSGASDSIADDMGAILDRSCIDDAQMIVRLCRKVEQKIQVIETCGPEAEQWYPEFWSSLDILNDRGVTIVPSSSRRRNTDVQSKLAIEGLTAAMAIPAMQLPEGQAIAVEILRRWFDDHGIAGLPWDNLQGAMRLAAEMQAMQAQMGMGGEDGDGEDAESEGEDATEDGGNVVPMRPSEMSEPSAASQAQGSANVGGGRIATGASRGDVQRLMRGKAG